MHCVLQTVTPSIAIPSIHFLLLSKKGSGSCVSNYGVPVLLPEVSPGKLGNAISSVNPGPPSRGTFPERGGVLNVKTT